jgi:hypothetical protein
MGDDDSMERRDALCLGDLIFLGNTRQHATSVASGGGGDSLLIADGFNSFGLLHRCPSDRHLEDDCLFRLCEPVSYRGDAAVAPIAAPTGFISPRSKEAGGGDHGGSGDAVRAAAGSGGGGSGTPDEGGSVGKPLHFGQVVQLEHVKSGKYLTAGTTEVAEQDPECMRCQLDNGSAASHFEVLPVWRIQSEGSAVFSSNRVRLLSCALGDHFLHAHWAGSSPCEGGGEGSAPSGGEVNLTHIGGGADTAWSVQLHRKHGSGGSGGGGGGSSPSTIQLGENVSFFHSEGEAYLRVHSSAEKCLDAMRAKMDGRSLKTFFRFEALDAKQGGPVCWHTPYRICQVTARGSYLALGVGGVEASAVAAANGAVREEDLPDTQSTIALETRAGAGVWEVMPTRVADKGESGPISWSAIRQFGCHICCATTMTSGGGGGGGGGGGSGGSGGGSEGKGGGAVTRHWIHLPEQAQAGQAGCTKARKVRLEAAEGARTGDAVCIHPTGSVLPLHQVARQVDFMHSCLRCAEDYVCAMWVAREAVRGSGRTAATATNAALPRFCSMLRRITLALRTAEVAGELRTLQAVMRECKLMDALMWCIAVPLACGCESGKGGLPPMLRQPQRLACLALARIIEGHAANKMYAARRSYANAWLFPALARQAGTAGTLGARLQGAVSEAFWAEKQYSSAAWLSTVVLLLPWRSDASVLFRCAVEDNMGAIMEHVSKSTLQQLVQFLLERGPRPSWLDLLSSVCVCNGQRIPQQQEAILRTVLSAKSFEGNCEAGSAQTRHRIFMETVRSKNPATIKYYAPKCDVAELDRLLGTGVPPQERENVMARAWEELVNQDGRRLSIVVALAEVCATDEGWRAPGGTLPCGVKPHQKGDDATTKRGRNQRQYIDGPRYYEAATAEGLRHFEAPLRAGMAHFDRGYNFLGKAMFLQGIPQLIVGFNRKTGIFGAGIENEDGGGPLLCCGDVGTGGSGAEPSEELLEYQAGLGVALGDLLWVPLEELCWVLDPLRLHARVFGKTRAPFDGVQSLVGDDRERFSRQRLFARWYEAQLKLLAMMSFGENTRCCTVLRNLVPFETCFVGMWNENLPKQIRTSFTELMTNLHVAVSPHRMVHVPRLVRRYVKLREDPDLTDENGMALPQAGPEIMRRLRLLKWLTADFFTDDPRQVIGNEPRNKFVLSLLRLQGTMVGFGFYGTARGIRDFLCDPLLKVLDGRSDERRSLTPDEGADDEADGPDAADADVGGEAATPGPVGGVPWAPTDRYTVTALTVPVMQCKARICHILLHVAACRVDYRLSKLLHAWWLIDNHQHNDEEHDTPDRCAMGRAAAKVFPGNSSAATSSLLAQLDVFASENAEQEYPAAIVSMFDQLFTQIFHSHDDAIPTLDFEKMTEGPFSTTCLDLLMYEDAGLFDVVMKLLVRRFETRRALRMMLNGVQLVKRSDVAAKAIEIEADIGLLDALLADFNVWAMGNVPGLSLAEQGQLRQEKLTATIQCIERLTSHSKVRQWGKLLSYATTKSLVPTKSLVHPSIFQDLLHNFGAYRRIMSILRLRRREVMRGASAQRAERIRVHNHILGTLRRHCCIFLTRFVRHHELNQNAVHANLAFFLRLLDDEVAELQKVHLDRSTCELFPLGLPAEDSEHAKTRDALLRLLNAIYKNNGKLVQNELPESLVWRLARLMQHTTQMQLYTEFFSSMCSVHGEPVCANQELVSRILADKRFSHSQWLDPEFLTVERRRDPAYRHLLDLWSAVCTGAPVHVHAKVQGLFPLTTLVETLEAERDNPRLCSSLLTLLDAAHISSDLREQKTGTNALLHEISGRIITVCDAFAVQAQNIKVREENNAYICEAKDIELATCVRVGVLKVMLGLMSMFSDVADHRPGEGRASEELKNGEAAAAGAKRNWKLVRERSVKVKHFRSAARLTARKLVTNLARVFLSLERGPLFPHPAVKNVIQVARTRHVVTRVRPDIEAIASAAFEAAEGNGQGTGRRHSVERVQALTRTHKAFNRFRAVINSSRLLKAREEAEFDALVRAVNGVFVATNPSDPFYTVLAPGAQMADKRSNGIQLSDLIRRFVRHLEPQLLPREEGAAADVHCVVFKIFRRLVEHKLPTLAPLLLEAHAPGSGCILADLREHDETAPRPTRSAARRASVLRHLDSMLCTTALLAVVLLAFLVGGEWVASGLDAQAIERFNWCCSGFFLLEVIVRSWAMGPRRYVYDAVCAVDLLCTSVDAAFIVGQETGTLESSGTGARVGRLLRLVRLLRFVRFARAAQVLHRLLHGVSQHQRVILDAKAAHASMQSRQTHLGVLKLTADTLAEPELYKMHDARLRFEVLATALRLLENGNRHVQNAMLELLDADDSCRLLHAVRASILSAAERVSASLDEKRRTGLLGCDDTAPPDSGWATDREAMPFRVLVLQLQLMRACCMGQHAGLQAHLRFQGRAARPANVVESAATLLVGICAKTRVAPALMGYEEMELVCALLDFLRDACFGPCVGNQQLLVHSGIVGAVMQLLGTALLGEVFLSAPIEEKGGRGGVLGVLLAELEAEHGSGNEALKARRAALAKPRQHCLSRVVSPLAVKARCAALLCALTEGLVDPALVKLIVGAVNVDTLLARVRAIFLLEQQIDALERAAEHGAGLPAQTTRTTGDRGLGSGLRGADLGSPLEVAKQLLLNAPSGKPWREALRREGDLLTIFCHTLQSRSAAMRAVLHRETSALGPDCEHAIMHNFGGGGDDDDGVSACYFRLVRLHDQRTAEQERLATSRGANQDNVFARLRLGGEAMLRQGSLLLAKVGSSQWKHYKQVERNVALFDVEGELKTLMARCTAAHEQAVVLRARLFFEERMSCVEVNWHGERHKIYFTTPPVSIKYIRSERVSLTKNIRTTSNQDKLAQFQSRSQLLCSSVPFNSWLDSVYVPVISWLVGGMSSPGASVYVCMRSQAKLEAVSFAVALCNAFLMLISLSAKVNAKDGTREIGYHAEWCATLNTTLGALQLALCVVVALNGLAQSFPVLIEQHFHPFVARMGRNEGVKFGDVLRQGVVVVLRRLLLVLLAMAVPGVLVYFRYDSPVLLHLALVAAAPLLFVAVQDYIGSEPEYYSSLLLKMGAALLFDPATAFNILLIVTAILGLTYFEFFFAIHLFKAVTMFPALANVVKAVTVPARQLGLTFLLFLICIYTVRVARAWHDVCACVLRAPFADPPPPVVVRAVYTVRLLQVPRLYRQHRHDRGTFTTGKLVCSYAPGAAQRRRRCAWACQPLV